MAVLREGGGSYERGTIERLDALLQRVPASVVYMMTSLIRNSAPLGPYSRTKHGPLWWPCGDGSMRSSSVSLLRWCKNAGACHRSIADRSSSIQPLNGRPPNLGMDVMLV